MGSKQAAMAPARCRLASNPKPGRHFYSETRSAPPSRAATVGSECGHHRRGTRNSRSHGHPNRAAPSAQHNSGCSPPPFPWCEFPGTRTQALPQGNERGERILEVSPRLLLTRVHGLTTPAPATLGLLNLRLCVASLGLTASGPRGTHCPEAHDGHHSRAQGQSDGHFCNPAWHSHTKGPVWQRQLSRNWARSQSQVVDGPPTPMIADQLPLCTLQPDGADRSFERRL